VGCLVERDLAGAAARSQHRRDVGGVADRDGEPSADHELARCHAHAGFQAE
jgi:hypothetical protein